MINEYKDKDKKATNNHKIHLVHQVCFYQFYFCIPDADGEYPGPIASGEYWLGE